MSADLAASSGELMLEMPGDGDVKNVYSTCPYVSDMVTVAKRRDRNSTMAFVDLRGLASKHPSCASRC